MELTQEFIDKLKDSVCSICGAPAHSKHSLDTAYFNDKNELIAVVNDDCSLAFDNAFRATFCKEESKVIVE